MRPKVVQLVMAAVVALAEQRRLWPRTRRQCAGAPALH